jgi:amino acid adenylation domain-containing protein
LVSEQIARTPDALAILSDDRSLTYRELGEQVAHLVIRLRALGVEKGDRVAVCVERSPEHVVAALAVLAAGAVYAPLDAAQPIVRLTMQLEDLDPRLIITRSSSRARIDASRWPVLALDGDDFGQTASKERPTPSSDDVAYIIFTSGSTGRPKGVIVEHTAICNQIKWRNTTFGISSADVVLQRIPLAFDPSIWELFGTLAAGGLLVLPPAGADADPSALVGLIRDYGITTVQVVPALLEALLDAPHLERCASLHRVFCGGDVLTPALRDGFADRLPLVELCNLYGPTEATIDTASWVCTARESGDRVPIGRPIANARLHVLDSLGNESPTGIPGELWIGGAGVAAGYLGNVDKTERRFVCDRFEGHGRLFRTGDKVRRRADGALEFLGRLDDQVKVRGVRVEPAEIEAALTGHLNVRDAAVAGPNLTAYVVPVDLACPPSASDLRRFLSDRLSDVMVPRDFVIIERLPYLPNGKVDRRSLPLVNDARAQQRECIAPSTLVEERIADIWRELLGVETLGVTDDFFSLGGHSLLAARLVARLESAFGKSIPMAALFRDPTIVGLARSIDRETPNSRSLLVPLRSGGTGAPLFLVHGLSGSALVYMDVARRLDSDRPVFAINARGLDDNSQPLATIEQMASLYVAAIREIRPEGPYLLGGWSMGGAIALEMAAQLRELGECVELVMLLDSAPPRFVASLDGHDEQHQKFERAETDQRTGSVVRANLTAIRQHRPRPGIAPVLIRAHATANAVADETFGWRDAGCEPLANHVIPGDHESMLRAPHSMRLAEVMSEVLACVQRPNPELQIKELV